MKNSKFYYTTTKKGIISKLNNHYYPYQHITTHTKRRLACQLKHTQPEQGAP